jgi:hypothetical protein
MEGQATQWPKETFGKRKDQFVFKMAFTAVKYK